MNIRKLAQRNLLAGRRADEQIADLLRVLAELRLHAHDEIEQLFALNHLRGGLAAHRRLHDGFHVGDVDAVARDLVAIDIDQQAGLAEFAHDGQFRESGHLRETALDLERLALQDIQVGSVDLYGERALQSGQRFVHRVFGRLRVVEDDSGKALSLLLDVLGQLGLVVDRPVFQEASLYGFSPT